MSLFGPPNVEKLSAKRDVRGLIKALNYEKDANVARAAATALGQIGGMQAIEALVTKLTDQNISIFAAKALNKLNDPHTMQILSVKLKDKDKLVRWGAVISLGKLGNVQCVELLITLLANEKDKDIGEGAVQYLYALQDIAKEPLITSLKDNDSGKRTVAASMLGFVVYPEAEEPLIGALEDRDSDVRAAARNALKAYKSEEEVTKLVQMASEKEKQTQDAINEAARKAANRIFGR